MDSGKGKKTGDQTKEQGTREELVASPHLLINRRNGIELTKQERVCEEIRDLIILGHYRLGEKLNQEELAVMLGTSITPVREALSKLASEGAIINKPWHGFAIPSYAKEDIIDMMDIWRLFRIYTVQRTLERCSDFELSILAQEMRELQPALQQMAEKEETVKFRRLLFQSNELVALASRSKTLVNHLRRLWGYQLVYATYIRERLIAKVNCQNELINAIKQRDLDKAVDAVNMSLDITIAANMEVVAGQ